MKTISLESVLLFALVIPYIMTYRLGWGTTPYWVFGIVFFCLIGSFVVDAFVNSVKAQFRLKVMFLVTVITFVIGGSFVSEIIVRHQTSPLYNIHDIILQQEAAIRFLLHGTNPYSATYFGTPMEKWHYSDTEINPALYHFVMQPLYLIFAIPFYFVSTRTIGFFDGRIPLLFLFLFLLGLASVTIKDKQKKLLFITLLAFNPAVLPYLLEGRSDMFMYPFMVFSFWCLDKKKYYLGAIAMALSFAVKQSAWIILPFYVTFLYWQTKSIKKTLQTVGIFATVFLLIVGPFLIWDASAFFQSTVLYLSGNTMHSYPISGYGWGMILLSIGIIKNNMQQYPFIYWQIAVCTPLLVFLLYSFKKALHVRHLILFYGIFLFVFWYFSRYFNNSHLGYLTMVFITAYFWPENDKKQVDT